MPHRDTASSARPVFTQVGYADIAVLREAGPFAFSIYTYLSLRLGKNQTAWPGIRTISKDTGISPAAVQTALKVLIEHRLITKHRRIGSSNHYEVHDPSVLGNSTVSVQEVCWETAQGVLGNSTVGVLGNSTEEDSVEEDSEKEIHIPPTAEESPTPQPRTRRKAHETYDTYCAVMRHFGEEPVPIGMAGRQMKIVKTWRQAGIPVEDIIMCGEWLSGQDWFDSGITIQAIQSNFENWQANRNRVPRRAARRAKSQSMQERYQEIMRAIGDDD